MVCFVEGVSSHRTAMSYSCMTKRCIRKNKQKQLHKVSFFFQTFFLIFRTATPYLVPVVALVDNGAHHLPPLKSHHVWRVEVVGPNPHLQRVARGRRAVSWEPSCSPMRSAKKHLTQPNAFQAGMGEPQQLAGGRNSGIADRLSANPSQFLRERLLESPRLRHRPPRDPFTTSGGYCTWRVGQIK